MPEFLPEEVEKFTNFDYITCSHFIALYLERMLVLVTLEMEIAEKFAFNRVRKIKSASHRLEQLKFECWDSVSMLIIRQTPSKLKKTDYSESWSENFRQPQTSLEKAEISLPPQYSAISHVSCHRFRGSFNSVRNLV